MVGFPAFVRNSFEIEAYGRNKQKKEKLSASLRGFRNSLNPINPKPL